LFRKEEEQIEPRYSFGKPPDLKIKKRYSPDNLVRNIGDSKNINIDIKKTV